MTNYCPANFGVVYLRSLLLQLLTTQLGTYTLANGTTQPAINVGNPPDTYKVTGLEVILPLVPDSKSQFLGEYIHRDEKWSISLIQHPGSNTIIAAADRLTRFLPACTVTHVPAYSEVGSFAQCRVSFRYQDLYAAVRL